MLMPPWEVWTMKMGRKPSMRVARVVREYVRFAPLWRLEEGESACNVGLRLERDGLKIWADVTIATLLWRLRGDVLSLWQWESPPTACQFACVSYPSKVFHSERLCIR